MKIILFYVKKRKRKIKRRGVKWKETRKKVLERDDYRCRICGKKLKNPDIHHIQPYRENRHNRTFNLISVCKRDHAKLEREYDQFGMTNKLRRIIQKNEELENKNNQKV